MAIDYTKHADETIEEYRQRIAKAREGATTTPTEPVTPTTTPTTTPTNTIDYTKHADESIEEYNQRIAKARGETNGGAGTGDTGDTGTGGTGGSGNGSTSGNGDTSTTGNTGDTSANDEALATAKKEAKDAQDAYYKEQSDYIQELKDQPSALENLKAYREEIGLPQLEKQIAGIDQTILDTEGLLANIDEDIRTRTEGLPVTEAAARRLTAMEQAPLSKQLSEQVRARQGLAAGYTAKQGVMDDYMTAAQSDLQRQQGIAEAGLGLSKERAEYASGRYTSAKEAYDTALKAVEDEAKTATTAETTAKKNILANINSAVDQYKLNPDGFREKQIESLIATYGEENRAYIKEQVYALMPNITGSTPSSNTLSTTIGGMLGLGSSDAKSFDSDIEQEIKKVYEGEYGTEGAREKALESLVVKYPGLDREKIKEIIYGSEKFNAAFPDGYEARIGGGADYSEALKELQKPFWQKWFD